MIVRQATPADSAALIALTASSPMKGRISLLINRKPDFFNLLNARGGHIVMVAEDSGNQIVGSFSAVRQVFTIDNHMHPVYYLGDLKVQSDYLRSSVAYRLVKAMKEEITNKDVDLFFCTAAEGNDPVNAFFEGRAGFPLFKCSTVFNVFQLLRKKYQVTDNTVFDIERERLAYYYKKFFRRYHFYPSGYNLQDCINICYIENGKIAAAISLYDPVSLKQNVIIDYPISVGLALAVLRAANIFSVLPSLPAKGGTLKLLYVKYAAFETGSESKFLQLIKAARGVAFKNNYHFLTMAVDEKDAEMTNLISPLSRFKFRSHQLIASQANNQSVIDKISSNLSYEDYSLI